jgi:hypothetical protein
MRAMLLETFDGQDRFREQLDPAGRRAHRDPGGADRPAVSIR